jgi:16S rRNA (cytosine967-C5)-methyltransferase
VSRYHSYLNSAKEILNQYKGDQPFALFIKDFFRQRKKYGSQDRKQITNLCYSYFRLGKTGRQLPVEERILLGLFLCAESPNEILEQLKPEWAKHLNKSATEKLAIGNGQLAITEIFPWQDELSNDIDIEAFTLSHLHQPDLFLRLRPGKEKSVQEKLRNSGIEFKILSENCLSLPNTSKLDGVIDLEMDAVVQDYNSQQTGNYIAAPANPKQQTTKVWDCCAGSGGKSLLAFDIIPDIDLTVSDKRESILVNLKKRFARAGIRNYKSIVTDLSTHNSQLTTHQFDLVLFDAPCTGSGTWSRTPEHLYYFKEEKIIDYSTLQKKMLANIIPSLKEGGMLLYITCSVFKKENEEIVEFIKENFHLQLKKMKILKGYDKHADSMFAAEFGREK